MKSQNDQEILLHSVNRSDLRRINQKITILKHGNILPNYFNPNKFS